MQPPVGPRWREIFEDRDEMQPAKISEDFLEGSADGIVEWDMLNMDCELSTPSLSGAIGPGIRTLLRPHWTYNAHCGDGIVPVNHVLKFETFGKKCVLRVKSAFSCKIEMA